MSVVWGSGEVGDPAQRSGQEVNVMSENVGRDEPLLVCFGCGRPMDFRPSCRSAYCSGCGLDLRVDDRVEDGGEPHVLMNKVPRLYPSYSSLDSMLDKMVYEYLVYYGNEFAATTRLKQLCGVIGEDEADRRITESDGIIHDEIARQRRLRSRRGVRGLMRRLHGREL